MPDTACEARLTVELTPDVPDATDAGFLSSLLTNHPDYRLSPQATVMTKQGAVEEPPRVQVSSFGIGSLYWAVRHPGDAWRVVLPIESGAEPAGSWNWGGQTRRRN
jgi:hypothetical protein